MLPQVFPYIYWPLTYSFIAGSVHTARARVRNPSSYSYSYDAKLYLGRHSGEESASATASFSLDPGQEKYIDFSVTMPTLPDTYHVYLNVYQEGALIGAYQAFEDVTISAPSSEPFIERFFIVTYKSGSNCPYEIHCDVKNQGEGMGTHTIELWIEGDLIEVKTFTIAPGEVFHYTFRYGLAPYGASGQAWIVADWGEQTIKIPFSAGYYTSEQAVLTCVRTAPTIAVLRYSSRSSWDSYDFSGRTPPTGIAEHSFFVGGSLDHWWLTIWIAISGLLAGRTYYAQGVGDGFDDETQFTTPSA